LEKFEVEFDERYIINPKSAIGLQILPKGLTNPPIGGLSGLTVTKKMCKL
jgi:hypothetical protein